MLLALVQEGRVEQGWGIFKCQISLLQSTSGSADSHGGTPGK
jgi:hypothetical protein